MNFDENESCLMAAKKLVEAVRDKVPNDPKGIGALRMFRKSLDDMATNLGTLIHTNRWIETGIKEKEGNHG